MTAAVLLGGAMMLFLAFFGLVGAILGAGAPFVTRTIFAVLAALAVATPIVGIRALFGSHRYSLVALTVLGALFLIGGCFAEPLGGAPGATLAVGPALLVLGVAAFAWWKWVTKGRHVDWHIGERSR
jgi:hypothetical protein